MRQISSFRDQRNRPKRARFHLYNIEELFRLPSADWLIDGIIEQPAVGFVFGPSGESKTFVTLDWAFSVAVGRPWHGRAVKQGPAVYVVAEGSSGIPSASRRGSSTTRCRALTMPSSSLKPYNSGREET